MLKQKTAIITGVGQDSSYLAEFLLKKDYKVILMTRRSGSNNFWRLKELNIYNHKNLKIEYVDITEQHNVDKIIKQVQPDELYNLAAQSFVQSSFDNPYTTTQVNYIGVLNLLEAIRLYSPHTRFYQASTSEMLGGSKESPQNENTPFYPRSPYGIAKLGAHWLTINYRESYGLFACCGILFNHESPLRGEEFITQKVIKKVAEIQKYIRDGKKGIAPVLEIGNMYAKRDWGHAKDYVKGMYLMLQQNTPDEYILSTGETYTIKDFIEKSFAAINLELFWNGENEKEIGTDRNDTIYIKVNPEFYRPAEVHLLLGDCSKAEKVLGWNREYSLNTMICEMLTYELKRIK